jgi:hypothetical protein
MSAVDISSISGVLIGFVFGFATAFIVLRVFKD